MKLSKILSKRVLSLFIVGLFVFTAFAVIQSGGGQAQASPSAVNSFTFPYQYGTPTVPSDVGAQGIQGLTVPKSDVGIQVPASDVGPQGTTGRIGIPNSQQLSFLNATSVSVSIRAYNGSALASPTLAVSQKIIMQNITYGNEITGYTDAHGYANFTLTKGYWQIEGYASNKSAYMNYSLMINVHSTFSKNIYFLPVTVWDPSVNNGGTSKTNIWIINMVLFNYIGHYGNPASIYAEPLEVELINDSAASPVVIAQTVEQFNDSAGFQNVNDAYQYTIKIEGWYNNLTATQYDISNETNVITLSGSVYTWNVDGGQSLRALNKISGGTLIGTPLPKFGSWEINSNTVVNDANLIISTGIWSAAHYNLYINNSFVIMNTSLGMAHSSFAHMSFYNSTVLIFGNMLQDQGYTLVPFSAVNSIIVGGSLYVPNEPLENASHSIIYDDVGGINGDGLPFSYWSNDTIEINATFVKASAQFSDYAVSFIDLGNQSITHSTFDLNNTQITMLESNVSIKYSIFSGENTIRWEGQGTANQKVVDNFSISNSSINGLLTAGFGIGANYLNFTNNNVSVYPPVVASQMYTLQLPYNSTVAYNNFTSYKNAGDGTYYVDEATGSFTNNIVYSVYESVTNLNVNDTPFIQIGGIGTPNSYIDVSHNLFYFGGAFGNYLNVNHNSFLYIEQTTSLINGGPTNMVISNNTFGYEVWNMTFFKWAAYNDTGAAGGVTLIYPHPGGNNITVVDNTFKTFIAGGGPGGPAMLILNPINLTMKNNVIENTAVIGNRYAPLNFSYDIGIAQQPPNIVKSAYNVISNNYFENLSNYTLPFCLGATPGGQATTVFTSNHFFYSPAPGESYLPPSIYYGISTNGSYPSFSNYNYIFNSSELSQFNQKSINLNHPFYGYKYIIAPDVNTLSGTPIISYSNGLVGGPQPNFEWKGYNYSESVEPTYIQVGVNSSKAPSIGLQFQGIAGALYDIEIFNNGSLISSYQESATSSGVLNATYNPATMPLDPIFYVEYVGSGVTPPPVVPPLVPIVPHVLFGIPYLNVIVLFGGIAFASEEFFRTQTKGKEKKYSYTGIFVGIMIAGIGLMSVL